MPPDARAHFIVLADTHYHPAAPKDFAPPKLLTRAPEILAATVPAVNALSPEFIIHVGDLLCGGGSFDLTPKQYEHSLQDVAATYAGFDAPLHCVPGNHDCDAQQYRFGDFARTFGTPGIFDVVDVAPRLRLARAHIFRDGEAGGGTWTDALDEALRAADAEARSESTVLLLMLHSWVHAGVGAPDKGIITNAAQLQTTLAECPAVAATFSGHRHTNRVRLFRDYVCIDTACLIGYPLGFRQITITDDGWLTSRWHTIDLPEILATSSQLADEEHNHRWEGEVGDRDTTVVLPRARSTWSPSGS